MRTFTAYVELDEETKLYVGVVPGVPGAHSQGATLDELQKAVAANPYPEADADPKSLHLTFLTRAPKAPDLTTLDAIRKDSERFALNGKVFYFHAPEGVARSKAFSRIEKSLGVAGTARNWRTACRILEMAEQIAT